ncbi:MAG: hypothetical protein COX19_13605 [Desulfobacterales bacterium CG23_combo_of_CG06-09_8_20_14_all_51_8]|nr:MAG: hypothetical protein COX19_13605 [Desulfobacterales bacterium CG23_combo_of_CG06-09_8_20_14_all_51_8]
MIFPQPFQNLFRSPGFFQNTGCILVGFRQGGIRVIGIPVIRLFGDFSDDLNVANGLICIQVRK